MPFHAGSGLKDPLSRPLCPGAGMWKGKATKGSRQLQLPMELLAPGQHIHLANSSVLSQRLSSPGCDVLSGTNRAGTVWGVGGEGSQGKWLWGNPPPEKRCL